MPRFLIPKAETLEERWYDRNRAERAGTLISVGKEGARSLRAMPGTKPMFVSAPSGRGKSHIAALLARESFDDAGAPVLVANVQDIGDDLFESIARGHPELEQVDAAECSRLMGDAHCTVVIDDWERARPEQRRTVERDVRRLVDNGSGVIFLGTPEAPPPRIDGLVSQRLLALEPRERSEYLRRRLAAGRVAAADRVARVLSAISGEAFFLAMIAEYYASRDTENSDDPRSIIAIMRRLLDMQLSNRCAADQAALFIAALQDLAVTFDRFSLQDAARSLSTAGAPELAGTLVSVAVHAGLVRQQHLNCYEFTHGLWRAFLLVASSRDDGIPDPADVERWMTSSSVRLRDAVGAMVPWGQMPEPARTKLLRHVARHDFQAYRNAVGALDALDPSDQPLHSLLCGIEDVASLLSERAREMVEPWSLYDRSVPGQRPGVLRSGPWMILRLRVDDESAVVDARNKEEQERLQPPTGRQRMMTLSRTEGVDFVVKQLHTLLERGWLPPGVLIRERLAYIELAVGRSVGTVSRLRAMARRHANDLLLGNGAVLENGAYRARFERCIDGYQGFTGREIMEWLDLAALAPSVKLRELRHPGPDQTDHRMFRDQYSPAQRLLRMKSVVPMAVEAFEQVVREDLPFLLPHSPFADGPSRLALIAEEETGLLHQWWEPCPHQGEAPRIEIQPTRALLDVEAIEEQVFAKAEKLGRVVSDVVISNGNILDWNPGTEAARLYASKLVRRALVKSCDRDVWLA